MRIGAHVRDSADPIGSAESFGVDLVQLFLTDPQKWNKLEPHPQGEDSKGGSIDVVVHSSYVLNVARLNNRIRIPSRKAVIEQSAAAAEIGAIGLVVHVGHVRDGEDTTKGVENWRTLFERRQDVGGFGVPIFIENTAGGDFAMARHFDDIARLWGATSSAPRATGMPTSPTERSMPRCWSRSPRQQTLR